MNLALRARQRGSWRGAALACLALALALLAHGAQAATATKASLRAYFDAAGTARQVSACVDAIAQLHEEHWRAEIDPLKKAALKEDLDDFQARVRSRMDWGTVEPIAIDIYRQHLSENEVRALATRARTPAGQLDNGKLKPALIARLAALHTIMLRVFAEAIGKQAPAGPATVLPAAGPDQALLLAYLRAMPGEQEIYKEEMALADSVTTVFIAAGDDQARRALLARTLDDLHRRLSFEAVTSFKAHLIAGVLTAGEIALLSADQRRPHRAALLRKLRKAESRLDERIKNAR